MISKMDIRICFLITGFVCMFLTGCRSREVSVTTESQISSDTNSKAAGNISRKDEKRQNTELMEKNTESDSVQNTSSNKISSTETTEKTKLSARPPRKISFDPSWKYAKYSQIHSGSCRLYYTDKKMKKNIIVCVNAGHGTQGGSSVKTLCHPDGSPKVVTGSTGKGAVKGAAISEGMTFRDGTKEADATLSLALILKSRLLDEGYDVLMIRESEDIQLDNIARTVVANNNADCHIALHYDSTESDKGAFFLSAPDVGGYRQMEPVKSHWKAHHALGDALIRGLQKEDVKIFQNGRMDMDLTQTSYSTIPSVDLELGDAASDLSKKNRTALAEGIVRGLNRYCK